MECFVWFDSIVVKNSFLLFKTVSHFILAIFSLSHFEGGGYFFLFMFCLVFFFKLLFCF